MHYFMAKLVTFVDPRDFIVNVFDLSLCIESGLIGDVSGLVSTVMIVV